MFLLDFGALSWVFFPFLFLYPFPFYIVEISPFLLLVSPRFLIKMIYTVTALFCNTINFGVTLFKF